MDTQNTIEKLKKNTLPLMELSVEEQSMLKDNSKDCLRLVPSGVWHPMHCGELKPGRVYKLKPEFELVSVSHWFYWPATTTLCFMPYPRRLIEAGGRSYFTPLSEDEVDYVKAFISHPDGKNEIFKSDFEFRRAKAGEVVFTLNGTAVPVPHESWYGCERYFVKKEHRDV